MFVIIKYEYYFVYIEEAMHLYVTTIFNIILISFFRGENSNIKNLLLNIH
jgi:hypothetical protein